MAIETTYSNARNNLASLLSQVTDDLEIVVIKRRGHKNVAMIDEAELSSLVETDYLLRSPRNAARLRSALDEVDTGGGERISVADLRKEFGVEKRKRK